MWQALEGVQHLPAGYNPATWVLEVTSLTSERHMGKNVADIYAHSETAKCVPVTDNMSDNYTLLNFWIWGNMVVMFIICNTGTDKIVCNQSGQHLIYNYI